MAHRSPRGFTLIELMIAVAITAVLAAMVSGAFSRIAKDREVVEGQDERYASARRALTRMARELSAAFVSDHYDKGRYREPPTLFRGRDQEILFTSMSHQRLYQDVKESDQSVLEYALDRDPDHQGEDALFRREKVRIDDDPDHGGRRDVVIDRVTSFRLLYWDRQRKDWVKEWSTRSVEHQNASQNVLPTRVRVELELKLPDGRTEKLSTEARIALTKQLDF
jgi:general secretion pathway protein J